MYDTLDTTAFGFFAAYTAIMGVVSLVLCIFSIIVHWRIFEKAYIPGWQSIIPFLSTWRFLQVAGLPPALMFLMFIPIVGWIALIFVMLIAQYKITKAFGGSDGMAVLSLFFGSIVLIILAFSKKYDYGMGGADVDSNKRRGCEIDDTFDD